VKLAGGREVSRSLTESKGMEDDPFDHEALKAKFLRLTADAGELYALRLFEQLDRLETQPVFTLAQAT